MIGTAMETWRAALAEWHRDRDPRALAAAMVDLSAEEAEQILAEIEDPPWQRRVVVEIWRATGDTVGLVNTLEAMFPGQENDTSLSSLTEEENRRLTTDAVRLLGPGFVSLLLSPGGPEAASGTI